jgi:hypothetical protein
MKMKDNYNVENVVRFIDDFVKKEEHFDSMFFDQLSCIFTTVALMCDADADTYACDTLIAGLWDDVKANYDEDFTIEDYNMFYDWMVKWIV